MKKTNHPRASVSRRISVKWKVFFTFLLYSAMLLSILWVMQILMLDRIYSYIKTESMKTNVDSIIDCLDSEDYADKLDSFIRENDLNIMIIDENYETHYSRIITPISKLSDLKGRLLIGEKYELSKIFSDAMSSPTQSFSAIYETSIGGKKTWIMMERNNNSFTNEEAESQKDNALKLPKGNTDSVDKSDDSIPQRNAVRAGFPSRTLVYTRVITFSDGSAGLIMIESVLTPVNATVATLSAIFVIIAIVLFMISLVLAFMMSSFITKPIIRINESAKKLSKGDYSVKFEGAGYKEISQLNDTLNSAATELSRVEGLRKELIANVSHDLRTPLTMIMGYAEAMRDIPGENTPENVQVIIDETSRLSSLVNDLLDNSKLQSGNMPFKKEEYVLTESVREIVSRYDKLVERDGFNIVFEYTEDVYIKADKQRISQVLYNLINNAINYTGDDKLIVIRQIVNGKYVRLEIEDTGDGITKEDLPYIWDRYYKVDKTHKRSSVGTGLGLSIVKSLLELHDAKYGVSSTVGKGSVFWFELERI